MLTISELINQLETIKNNYGDIGCCQYNDTDDTYTLLKFATVNIDPNTKNLEKKVIFI